MLHFLKKKSLKYIECVYFTRRIYTACMPQRNHKQLFSAKRSSFIKIFFLKSFFINSYKNTSQLSPFSSPSILDLKSGRQVYCSLYTGFLPCVIIVMEQIPEISRKIKLGFSSIFFAKFVPYGIIIQSSSMPTRKNHPEKSYWLQYYSV